MLQLKLSNFKQHKSLEVEFPSHGIIRLHGRSGAGKTSIFDAIRFAITGEGDDIAPWDASVSTTVEMMFNDIYIKRTRASATLYVKLGDQESVDDAGQSLIYKYFSGFTDEVFLAAAYIRAGMEESLLHLSPAEQLKFVEGLFSEPVVDKIKANIQSKITEYEKSFNVLGTQHEFAKKAFEAEPDPVAPTPPVLAADDQELFNKAVDVVGKIPLLSNELNKLHSAASNPEYAKQASAVTQITLLEEQRNGLQVKLDQLRVVDHDYGIKVPEWDPAKLSQKRKRLDLIQKMRELASNLATIYGKPITQQVLHDMRVQAEAAIVLKRNDLAAVTTNMQNLKALEAVQSCPHCEGSLTVQNGKVLKTADLPADFEKQWQKGKETFEQLNTDIIAWSGELSRLTKDEALVVAMKSQLVDDPYPGMTAAQLDEAVREVAEFDQLVRDANNRKIETQKETGKLLLEISLIDSKVNDLKALQQKVLRPVAEILQEIETIKAKRVALELFISQPAVVDAQNKVSLYNRERDLYTERHRIYMASEADRQAKFRNLQDMESKLVGIKLKLAAFIRLKEQSDAASMTAIDGILNTVNAYAMPRLERMFPLDGTSIVLKNQSVTQKGEIRPKISLDIVHKAKSVKKIRSLSLGEKSRAYLAFQLALTDLYQSPFLMIDEGFPGLPDTQLEECLQILREESVNKLILVIEHGAPDHMFDKVVTIDA